MRLLILGFFSGFVLFSSINAMAACTLSTPEIDQMEIKALSIQTQAGDVIELPVRVADDWTERAGGFQHVCAQVAEQYPIYFQFERSFNSAFHMRNVYTELDIAFIDDSGQIISIQRMKPNSLVALQQNLYYPPSPARGALETAPGYYAKIGVRVGDRIVLKFATAR
ncbi:MAG: DUF192 domain-containing protein [Proteobacteria bacterium]|jgi:uncharacterized membrane protein (UPF0127 family)|nr:DUF192 domain-containing protein [Pseudomonadota bacterium]